MSKLELEFEADQLRDVVLFELRTATGDIRKKLMRARNILWLIGTEIFLGNVELETLWKLWKEAVNITIQVIRNMYQL
jgi:hypothetical protein